MCGIHIELFKSFAKSNCCNNLSEGSTLPTINFLNEELVKLGKCISPIFAAVTSSSSSFSADDTLKPSS